LPVIDASNSNLAKKIAVLGAPIDIGASQRGTLMGPAALRTAGLLTLLDGLGFEVRDHGDLSIGDVADWPMLRLTMRSTTEKSSAGPGH